MANGDRNQRDRNEVFVDDLEKRETSQKIDRLEGMMKQVLKKLDDGETPRPALPPSGDAPSNGGGNGGAIVPQKPQVVKVFYDTPEQRSLNEQREREYQKQSQKLVSAERGRSNMYSYTSGVLENNYDVNVLSDERIVDLGATERSFDHAAAKIGHKPWSEQIGGYVPFIVIGVIITALIVELLQPGTIQPLSVYFENQRNQYFVLIVIFALGIIAAIIAFLMTRRKEKTEIA